jgi:hypothetical protein
MLRGTLPAGPFLAWADGRDMGVIGVAAGLTDGALTRAIHYLRHERAMATLRSVDQCFVAAGQPHQLALLYPQEIDMDDRWCPTCVELTTVDRADNLCPWCETPLCQARVRRSAGRFYCV